MFNRVIAGFDGYDGGRDAIFLAQRLRPERLTVLMAYGAQTVVAPTAALTYWEECRADARRRLAAACMELGAEAEQHVVADTSPARALHDLAAERHADLLVIGSSHRGPLGRLLVGDVGTSVLLDAPCAVAIAPKRLRDGDWAPRRVGIAYDGSDGARAALSEAVALALQHDATLVVCTAWDTPLIAAAAYPEGLQRMTAEAEQRARETLDAADPSDGVRTERRLLHGRAASALAEASHDLDLLVVGSRGWGSTGRVVLGGTAHHLARRAACPLVVLPRPVEAAGPDEARRPPSATTAP
jgi:nucleotide-binding universal stress UspA family protein